MKNNKLKNSYSRDKIDFQHLYLLTVNLIHITDKLYGN